MKRVVYMVFALILVTAATCLAQKASTLTNCSLVGAWYGGMPDVPYPYYTAAITAQAGDRYSIVYQYYGEITPPYLYWTDWKGNIVKKHGQTYTGLFFQMARLDPASSLLPPGVDPLLPEMDFIHIDHLEMIDCNTFRVTYDKWYTYYNFTNDIKPLQSPPPPGSIWIIDPPLVEVYHRIPEASASVWSADLTLIGPETQVQRGPLPARAIPR